MPNINQPSGEKSGDQNSESIAIPASEELENSQRALEFLVECINYLSGMNQGSGYSMNQLSSLSAELDVAIAEHMGTKLTDELVGAISKARQTLGIG